MTRNAREELLEKAARLMLEKLVREKRPGIALTGAGVSAESGIPTFRGENGLWKKYRAEDLATPEAFQRNPRLVWEWYKWRLEIVLRANPNPAHYALVELERMGLVKCVVTQNVDGLHQAAGQKCVVELHGNIRRARCTRCGYKVWWEEPPRELPPRCPRCGGLLRPDVVWFGEPLPQAALSKALELASEAGFILVVGTSGVVMPAGMLPSIVKEGGGVVIEVNVSPSAITWVADVFIEGRAGEVLPRLVEKVGRLAPGLLRRS